MRESRFRLIALLPVLIALFAIYAIIPWPWRSFAGMDFLNLSFPRVLLAKDMLLNGHLPLWNWHEWGGVPLLATHLGALVYPPTWLAALLPLPYGSQVFVFVHLCLAGVGAWQIGRKIFSLDDIAAAYGGIAYAGSAFFVGRIEQFQVIAVNCLLPWLLLCLWQAVHGRRGGLWLPAVWALSLLAGHPQFALLNLAGAVGFLLVSTVASKGFRGKDPVWGASQSFPFRKPIFGWIQAGAFGLIGTALAAVQLLPTWELGQQSERFWPYPDPTAPELAWTHLPALLIPRYYNLITQHGGRVAGYTELGLYAGLLTLPLAVIGLAILWRGQKNQQAVEDQQHRQWSPTRNVLLAAAVVWIVAMWIALGKNAFLGSILYEKAPFLKQSRGAARSLNVAALMLALLSAVGVQRLSDRWIARWPRSPFRRLSRWPAVLLCGLTTGDLALSHADWLTSVTVPRAAIHAPVLIPADVRQHLGVTGDRVYRFMAFDSDFYLDEGAAAVRERRARLQPNLADAPSVYLLDGYEEGLLPTRRRANLLRKFNRNLRGPSPDPTLLAWMGSATMLTEYPLAPRPDDWAPAGEPFLRPPTVPSLDPGRNARYQWWKSQFTPASFLSLDTLFAGDTEARAFLEQAAKDFPLEASSPTPAGRTAVPHALQAITPEAFGKAASVFQGPSSGPPENALKAAITGPVRQALVLFSPSPGWKAATEKSQSVQIKPLNSLFYVVQLNDKAAVPSTINLIYSPFSFRIGLFLTLSACVLYILLILEHRCLRTREQDQD